MDADRTTLATAGIGAAFVAICCVAPLLTVALGAIGVVAWITHAAYVLIPLLLVLIPLVGIWLYRRRTATKVHRKLIAFGKAKRHE